MFLSPLLVIVLKDLLISCSFFACVENLGFYKDLEICDG